MPNHNDDYPNTFAGRLNYLMEEYGDSKNRLVKLLGVSTSTINYYLSGERTPQTEKLILIAKRYHVTTDWLLCMPEAHRSIESDSKRIESIELLSEKAIQFLRNESSEYHLEQYKRALDFMLCNDYSSKFLDSVSDALSYLDDSAKYPNITGGIMDPGDTVPVLTPNYNQSRINKAGYLSILISFYQQAKRNITAAQTYLSKMFEAQEENIKQSLKRQVEDTSQAQNNNNQNTED